MLAKVLMESHKPLFPRWYDLNAYCDFHYGAQGHTIENCTPLRNKVQALVKAELLNLNKVSGLNVMGNPLPDHVRPKINAIVEDSP